jgi:hypothetical protein
VRGVQDAPLFSHASRAISSSIQIALVNKSRIEYRRLFSNCLRLTVATLALFTAVVAIAVAVAVAEYCGDGYS